MSLEPKENGAPTYFQRFLLLISRFWGLRKGLPKGLPISDVWESREAYDRFVNGAVDDTGYQIDEAEVIYWGRSPGCVAATSISPDG